MDDKSRALLLEMSHGVQLAFRNAEELFAEAELLREKGHHARALALHQISIEECGKIEIIGGWAMHVFLGSELDPQKMVAAFRSHKAKNYANAYYTEVLGDELKARKSGDAKAVMEAFKALQQRFHKDSNDAKNAALYVDFMDGKFFAPRDVITEHAESKHDRKSLEGHRPHEERIDLDDRADGENEEGEGREPRGCHGGRIRADGRALQDRSAQRKEIRPMGG